MYVWLDALNNYVTACGFPDETAARWPFWPADVHMVGKDIIRFHAVYWPALLMAAGLPLPRAGFLQRLVDGRGREDEQVARQRASSRGSWRTTFGLDQIRYFLLREKPFGADGSFSHNAMMTRTNVELANDLGNLAQRSLSLIARNCDGGLPGRGPVTEDDRRCWLPPMRCRPGARQAGPSGCSTRRWRRSGRWCGPPTAISTTRRRGRCVDRCGADGHGPARAGRCAARDCARCCSRSCRTAWRRCSTSSACRRMRGGSPPGHSAAGRYCPAGAARSVSHVTSRPRLVEIPSHPQFVPMLIDSHCHLDYFTEAELPDVLARAAAAGVARDGYHRHDAGAVAGAAGAGRGACRMSGAPSASTRITPRKLRFPHLTRIAAHDRASAGDRHRRVRAWTISTTRRRATCSRTISAPISAPRSCPACRSPSMPATPTTTSRESCKMNAIAAGISLSCCTASARRGRWPRRRSEWAVMSASRAS